MRRSAIKAARAPTPAVLPPDHLIDVTGIIGVAFAADRQHIELSVRDSGGKVVMLRISRAAMTEALARLSDQAVLVLETSTDEPAAKLSAPMGAWEIVQEPGATSPTLECRTADGRGVAVAFGYDPITAIPQLQVAVDV
jgi:hypothetical protein